MVLHKGGCHCGAVTFEFESARSPRLLACNCSICAMTGFVHLIIPARDFSLISGETALTTYTFGSGIAKHHFCRHCGVKSFYIPRSNPDGVSINWHCVDHASFDEVFIEEFDGGNWEEVARTIAYLSE